MAPMTDHPEPSAEALEAENRILRGLVQTNEDWSCPQGAKKADGSPVRSIGECPFGFPGCGCADDRIAILCEDEERIVSALKAEVERLREENAAIAALESHTHGVVLDTCEGPERTVIHRFRDEGDETGDRIGPLPLREALAALARTEEPQGGSDG